MSDLLSAAAAALGTPEALVRRSAEARATATGATVDEILAAWAGGAPAPTAPAATTVEAEEDAGDDAPEVATEATPPPPEIVVEMPSAPAPAPAPVGPYRPPVLVGVSDNPMTVLAGVVGLFFIVLVVGLIGPSIQTTNPGARSSSIEYSESAIDGRHLFANLGCASCHTQMVRPVIADVGLGAVTLNDSNQLLGTRRFGPDLSNVGARLSGSQIEAVIGGLDGHPRQDLSAEDMTALVSYLAESITAESEG
jgi:hypothetical protein